ncbi:hypothetical protein LOTGIDRAFT_159941 [Lottia gigantea]|uniref:Uncharacterized protein n=1 Tax=Lottia gigantea TaxID=225164 RepID=V4AP08_LOTGI|nr:hypothetical protein LOTGIDRAFT_159941 [Lottia gigantea]ESO96525.1 hypothetical protein LOTGIDRAFT_159941 [Lottia gigantea]
MAEVSLDPVLRAFWERFPCPPSWNNDLLFRTNWTSCVAPSVGERIIVFMADKCGIKNLPSHITPPPRAGAPGDILEDACSLNCKIIVALVCVLFVIFTVTGIIIIIYRKRKCKRKSSPPHPSSGDKMFTSGINNSRRQAPTSIPASASLGDQNQNPLLRRPLPPLPNNCHFANYRILPDGDNSSSCASHSTGGHSPVYEYIDDPSVHYGCQPCHTCHRHSREIGCVACVPTRQNCDRNSSQDLIRFSFGHPGYNDDPGDEIWFDEQGRQYNAPWNDRQLINMFKNVNQNDPRIRDVVPPRRSQSGHRLSRDSREMMPVCGCQERYQREHNYRGDMDGGRIPHSLSNETQFVNLPNDGSGVTIHYNPRNSQGFQDGRRRAPSRGNSSHRLSRPEMPLSPSGDRLSSREGTDRRPIPAIHTDYFSSDA